jgi:hypothetical protein
MKPEKRYSSAGVRTLATIFSRGGGAANWRVFQGLRVGLQAGLYQCNGLGARARKGYVGDLSRYEDAQRAEQGPGRLFVSLLMTAPPASTVMTAQVSSDSLAPRTAKATKRFTAPPCFDVRTGNMLGYHNSCPSSTTKRSGLSFEVPFVILDRVRHQTAIRADHDNVRGGTPDSTEAVRRA